MRKSIFPLWVSATLFSSPLNAQSVTEYEYWIDQHTEEIGRGGIENGHIDFNLDVSSLSEGFHTFTLRVHDSEDRWSIPYTKLFYRVSKQQEQDVVAYEYWTDYNTADIKGGSIEGGNINLNVDASALSAGFHALSLRFRSSDGKWSTPYTQLFYRTSQSKGTEICAYEYYVDDNADGRITVDAAGIEQINFDIDASSLSTGLHKLSLRTKDSEGQWSTPHIQYFYHVEPPKQTALAYIEYYLDEECNTRQKISTDSSGEFDTELDLSRLTDGLHKLYLRVQDTDSAWSTPYCRLFCKEGETKIIGYEYWFNKEYDERKFEHIEPVEVYDMKNVHIDVTSVWNMSDEDEDKDAEEDKENVFHIRFKTSKGQWSELISHTFTKGQLQMDLADYEILKAFYHATGGAEWNETWDISSSEINADQWNGVNFRGGKVYDIYLPDNNLTGTLPAEIFTLTELTDIDLSGNKLSGKIDSISAEIGEKTVSAVLSSVNLSHNELCGEVSAFAQAIPAIEKLNLSGNRLTEISSQLPESLKEADLSNQFVDYFNEQSGIPSLVRNAPTHILQLGETMDIPLNTLQLYGFTDEEGNPNEAPDFQIADKNGTTRLYLKYDPDIRTYKCPLDKEWQYATTDTLVAIQESGLASGYSMNVLLDYAMGDANIDHTVDVLDIQHSLNYILSGGEECSLPFNFAAADTYKDATLTVQDIVKTVDIVLDTKPASSSPMRRFTGYATAHNAEAHVFIQNGRLILDTHTPVAAIDITIDHADEGELLSLINSSKFTCICRQSADHTLRMLIYSLTGATFAKGQTELAKVCNSQSKIAHASLADTHAHYIAVSIDNIVNGIELADDSSEISAHFNGRQLVIEIPSDNNISVTYCDMQGHTLAVQNCGRLSAGTHAITPPLTAHGVYIAKISSDQWTRTLKIKH